MKCKTKRYHPPRYSQSPRYLPKVLAFLTSCPIRILLFFVALSWNVMATAQAEKEEEECPQNTNNAARVLLDGQFVSVDDTTKFQTKFYSTTVLDDDNNYDIIEKRSKEERYYYVLNDKKPVLYVPNFLNETMAQEIKSICIDSKRFEQSNIRGHGDSTSVEKNKLRTSESCMLVPAAVYLSNPKYAQLIQEEPLQPQISKIKREVDLSWDIAMRASNILSINPYTVEALQIVRYTTPDAQYKLHHDHGGYYKKQSEHRPWTMLIYLNDVSKGGYTAFPELSLEVPPRGGDALVWSNVNQEDGTVDCEMVHMGRPPSEDGVKKYAINVWFGAESLLERKEKSEIQ